MATVAVMPMKRLMTMRNTYAVEGTSNQKDAGYMMGVMDHLKGDTHLSVCFHHTTLSKQSLLSNQEQVAEDEVRLRIPECELADTDYSVL